MQTPRPDAPEQIGIAELVLAGDTVGNITERAVEGQDLIGDTGIDHPGDRVMPQVLLEGGSVGLGCLGVGVGAHHVVGVATADPGGLHPAVGGQVSRPER